MLLILERLVKSSMRKNIFYLYSRLFVCDSNPPHLFLEDQPCVDRGGLNLKVRGHKGRPGIHAHLSKTKQGIVSLVEPVCCTRRATCMRYELHVSLAEILWSVVPLACDWAVFLVQISAGCSRSHNENTAVVSGKNNTRGSRIRSINPGIFTCFCVRVNMFPSLTRCGQL